MSPSVTWITSHSLDGPESKENYEEQRRFAEFVTDRQPQLLDFQAYISEDNHQLKLMFAFHDVAEGGQEAASLEQRDWRFRDSGLAGILAGTVITVLVFAAAYLGSVGAPAG